jgi:hypothetical protein
VFPSEELPWAIIPRAGLEPREGERERLDRNPERRRERLDRDLERERERGIERETK